MIFKKFIPKFLVIKLKLKLRKWNDYKTGISKSFASIRSPKKMEYSYVLNQEIKKSEYFENKIHNINLGIKFIDNIEIKPNQIFSFWNLIPQPNRKNNFKESRNIMNGKLTKDFGGGLCQLSSIIYHQALRLGFEIIERHNHSLDLYHESERFTPLGSDATVVFAYKDLRFKNNTNCSIILSFNCKGNELSCIYSSDENLEEFDLIFMRTQFENQILVETQIAQTNKIIAKSVYKRLN